MSRNLFSKFLNKTSIFLFSRQPVIIQIRLLFFVPAPQFDNMILLFSDTLERILGAPKGSIEPVSKEILNKLVTAKSK